MLTYEQKIAILDSFPELERKNVSLGRVNYHYPDSGYDKKTVAYHLHPNGNGFVYAGHLYGYEIDDKGLVNIRDYTEEELRAIVSSSIRSLTNGRPKSAEAAVKPVQDERWIGPDDVYLTVKYDNELWYIYAGDSLEIAFETFEEVEEYMLEEGFARLSNV
ncbi:hypothetical protein ACFO9Q_00330 [Paenibacillus sp. GCM10023252]|uniref:hypothetical protein n=1 Tax=Paenibacillus sp. GCM10023252 TaxID=3252649 RepID=UPI00361173AC